MSQQDPPITRRSIAKGAAWTVPVVALGSAAPAIAASCPASRPCPPPVVGFGAVTGTGVYSSTSTWGPQSSTTAGAGFRNTDPLSGNTSNAPWYGLGGETSSAATVSVSLKTSLALVGGCAYNLTFNASTYQGQVQTTLTIMVGNQAIYSLTPPTTGQAPAGVGLSNVPTSSGPFSVSTSASYSFSISIALAASGSSDNNDIYISNLVLSCA